MSLPKISAGGSSMPIALPSDLDIFSTPSSPTSSGSVMTTCGSSPSSRMRSRPTSRLKSWSVPPSSTSAFNATESYPCASG